MSWLQVAITDAEMRKIGSGAALIQYLKAEGLNPYGKIKKERLYGLTVYTEERGEDDKQAEVGEVPTMDRGIR
jgi:hypothetical protein